MPHPRPTLTSNYTSSSRTNASTTYSTEHPTHHNAPLLLHKINENLAHLGKILENFTHFPCAPRNKINRYLAHLGPAHLAFALLLSLIACSPLFAASSALPSTPNPGKPFDLQAFINKELRAGHKHITIPPGRYRVTPTLSLLGRCHLLLSHLDHVDIIADGVDMICTENTRAVHIDHCTNTTLRGLSIDYDPLPYTQGRIIKLSDDKQTADIQLFADYPAPDTGDGWKYEIYDPQTTLLRFGSYYQFTVDRLPNNRIRLTKAKEYLTQDKPEQVGDVIVIAFNNWSFGQLQHALFLNQCDNMQLENVSIFASNCFGFFEVDCNNSTYRHCRVDRRPPQDDPVQRAVPRMRSLNADAFHSKYAIKGPQYLQCIAKFNGDDSIAINGDYDLVTASQDNTLRILAKSTLHIHPGSTVDILSPIAGRLPPATVLEVKPAGAITSDEHAFLLKQPMDEGSRHNQFGSLTQGYDITLDRRIDIPRGSVISATDHIGNNFLVSGCDLGFNRSRGAIIKAGKGKIIDNHFTENHMESIRLSPELWWLEAGCGDNIQVTSNTITRCHSTAVHILAEVEPGHPLPAGAHKNITITNNHIIDCPPQQIRASSIDTLLLQANTITPAPSPTDAHTALKIENCTNVTTK